MLLLDELASSQGRLVLEVGPDSGLSEEVSVVAVRSVWGHAPIPVALALLTGDALGFALRDGVGIFARRTTAIHDLQA